MDQFESGRGGPREGAGRPPGSPNKVPMTKRTNRTERLYERLTPTEKAQLEEYLQQLRQPR